jgi:hypothetical protein
MMTVYELEGGVFIPVTPLPGKTFRHRCPFPSTMKPVKGYIPNQGNPSSQNQMLTGMRCTIF